MSDTTIIPLDSSRSEPDMPRHERPAPSDVDHVANGDPSSAVIQKGQRLTLPAPTLRREGWGREPRARNLRKARENRRLSQAAVAKKLRLSRSLVAQIELANRPDCATSGASWPRP